MFRANREKALNYDSTCFMRAHHALFVMSQPAGADSLGHRWLAAPGRQRLGPPTFCSRLFPEEGAMNFPSVPDLRLHVLSRAGVAVEKAVRAGGVLKVTVEAQRIFDEGGTGDLSVAQIAADIVILASNRGLLVETGEGDLKGLVDPTETHGHSIRNSEV